MKDELDGRPRRVKGSGDHNWQPWDQCRLGRGRICLDCGREDDGYQQPCETPERTVRTLRNGEDRPMTVEERNLLMAHRATENLKPLGQNPFGKSTLSDVPDEPTMTFEVETSEGFMATVTIEVHHRDADDVNDGQSRWITDDEAAQVAEEIFSGEITGWYET